MRISLIVAMDANGVIGAAGAMPWHLPDDLRWFKQNTQGKTIVMGRRTFQAIGRALPKRRNIVVTRNTGFAAQGVETVPSFDRAIEIAQPADELMVIGGAQIYALALPWAGRLLITHIEAEYPGDTHFTEIDWAQWQLVSEIPCPATASTPAYRFATYDRIDV
jgi:dihydrofolate reductase